jgi:MFS family permease
MQTVLSVVLEVQPESADVLRGLIDKLRYDEEHPPPGTEPYGRLMAGVPVLHFLALTVFPGADYDPIFVIEANFDGRPGPFWALMEATLGPELRAMLRCCKRPGDNAGPLYDAVTEKGSVRPVAAYLEARTLTPSVFHQGNRGLDRGRILQERALFLATRAELAQPASGTPYRGMTAEKLHARLRAALAKKFPWLDAPAPPRIPTAERARDVLRLVALLVAVLFCLSVPGMVVALIATTPRDLMVLAVLAVLVGIGLWRLQAPLKGHDAPRRSGGLTWHSLSPLNPLTSLAHPATFVAGVLLLLALYMAVASALGALFAMAVTGHSLRVVWWPTVRVVGIGLIGAFVFSAPAIVLWLRRLERRDSSQDAPPVNHALMRDMAEREDLVAQNHMGSVVLVKPGILRMALFRAGHLGLGLFLRMTAISGYLGSMRTVHFAHWAFVNNRHRLMFFSNFDHSWESYLDDFIEKAHGGLTLAWGSGVGFPPARLLVLDGASHGRKFKAWARHSMVPNVFWFTAYKDLTVDQIERNFRIADGLRKAALGRKEAEAWATDL